MVARVAWLGLGNMGRGMAKNLAAKAELDGPLIVYNRTVTRTNKFQAENSNTVVAESVLEAVSSADIVFTCLSDDNAVRETVNSIIGSGNLKEKLFIDCSMIHPDTTAAIARQFQDVGAEFVASPVFGVPAMADVGQVICVLAGPSKSVDKVKPFTTGVIAKSFIDFSDHPHAKASQLKIFVNIFVLRMVESIAEGHVVAEKCGLGTQALHQSFEAIFWGLMSHTLDVGSQPLFPVDLARKDARHAMNLAQTSLTTMKGVELVEGYLEEVNKHMGERGDVASIYGAVRQDAGLKFENKE
ncbi:NAD(P)-binding protein [Penicillium angulare]|uniref:NAD(P)-binding protein n=1 Tax=Penicillium angulare TaxID=116970 RepID=UPI0025420C62|nr:NAD(P)-binding protein [Penicillium angulare]KAJ5260572.1 NAD(P)-binding protein [Penicillium angulare]